jgi:Cu-Zn family superoxide dismutase
MRKYLFAAAIIAAALSMTACEEPGTVTMYAINADGMGSPVGKVKISENPYGLLFAPNLSGLTPGIHGFHIHENPDCSPAEKDGKTVPGLAAGGHYDPANTGTHLGPYADGHLGDLPALYVDADGQATTPVLGPRLKPEDLAGRSLMIHADGDNYSDSPTSLGGGGARMACGTKK